MHFMLTILLLQNDVHTLYKVIRECVGMMEATEWILKSNSRKEKLLMSIN